MTLTQTYAQRQFDYFNLLIWNGALPRIPLVIVRARSFLGKCCYVRTKSFFSKGQARDFSIRLSSLYDLDERTLQDVIIHEMIHYYIAWSGIKDTSAHGEQFRAIMRELNAKYGRNISIRYKKAPNEDHSGTQKQNLKKTHYVCVSVLSDARMGITVCNESMYPRIRDGLKRCYPIRESRWYVTCDPYFNRFPHSRKPRIYLVKDMSTLMPKLSEQLNGRE